MPLARVVTRRFRFVGSMVIESGTKPGPSQMYAAEQFTKSIATVEPEMGLFARSRTTTTNGLSPRGHAVRQDCTLELAGEGTAASERAATVPSSSTARMARDREGWRMGDLLACVADRRASARERVRVPQG